MINFALIVIVIVCMIISVVGLFEILCMWEAPKKLREFLSSINPFKKKEVSSEDKEEAKEHTDFSIPEFGIKGYTGECFSAGATISFDPSVIDQLDSMQKQINALSADLYRLEETEYEHHVDVFKELNRLSEILSSKKKPAKKKSVKRKTK